MVRLMAALVLGAIVAGATAGVEPIGPGRYSGIIIFDRWDGCILYRGAHVLYVSEAVKEKLRDRAGKHVTLDATEVWQPMNPGDALIKQFTLVNEPEGMKENPLAIEVEPELNEGKPAFLVRLTNKTAQRVILDSDSLGATILARRTKHRQSWHFPEDGPSFAMVTRQSFGTGSPLDVRSVALRTPGDPTAKPLARLPFTLETGEQVEALVAFSLPEGQYQFLAGYGRSPMRHVASKLIAFDVDAEGKATSVVENAK